MTRLIIIAALIAGCAPIQPSDYVMGTDVHYLSHDEVQEYCKSSHAKRVFPGLRSEDIELLVTCFGKDQ